MTLPTIRRTPEEIMERIGSLKKAIRELEPNWKVPELKAEYRTLHWVLGIEPPKPGEK